MPYVERDINMEIKGVYANLQEGYAEEYLVYSDPGVTEFLDKKADILPSIHAIADIYISEGSVSFVTTSAGIGGAFYIDVGTYWVFFSAMQPDTAYMPLCYNHNHTVFVSEKYEDFFVVTALYEGVPSDPVSLSVEVKRVK